MPFLEAVVPAVGADLVEAVSPSLPTADVPCGPVVTAPLAPTQPARLTPCLHCTACAAGVAAASNRTVDRANSVGLTNYLPVGRLDLDRDSPTNDLGGHTGTHMPTIWPRPQGAMSILEPTSGELGAFPQQNGSAVVCGRGAGHGTGVHGGAARPGSTGVRARRAEPGAGRGAVRGRREHALSLAVELTGSTPIAKASVTLGWIA